MNILKSIGGSDFVSIVNNVMSKLLTNCLAISYSFIGKQKKKSFKDELPTHLRLIISKIKKKKIVVLMMFRFLLIDLMF